MAPHPRNIANIIIIATEKVPVPIMLAHLALQIRRPRSNPQTADSPQLLGCAALLQHVLSQNLGLRPQASLAALWIPC